MLAEYQAAKQFKIPSDAGAAGKTSKSPLVFLFTVIYVVESLLNKPLRLGPGNPQALCPASRHRDW